jgi:hypothetical protein
MKWVLSILLFIAALPVLSQNVVPNDPLTSNLIRREKYTLVCPGSWSVDTSKMLGSDLFLFSPLTDSGDNFRENVNVYFMSLKGQNYDLLRMGMETEKQIGNFVTNVQIIESRLDTSNSAHFYLLRYTGQQGKFELAMEQRFYLKDEVGYAVTFTAVKAKEEFYKDISALILKSFSLL